jgi:hypothetical protein
LREQNSALSFVYLRLILRSNQHWEKRFRRSHVSKHICSLYRMIFCAHYTFAFGFNKRREIFYKLRIITLESLCYVKLVLSKYCSPCNNLIYSCLLCHCLHIHMYLILCVLLVLINEYIDPKWTTLNRYPNSLFLNICFTVVIIISYSTSSGFLACFGP